MIIPFPDWAPDASNIGSRANITVTNCVPSVDGYQPFKDLNVLTGALDSRPLGAIEAFDYTDTYYQYAGTATKLYQLNLGSMNWDDVTNAGGDYSTSAGERWEMVRWENKVLAVNWDNNPQQITMGGSNFSDLTTAFKAREIAVVGDFVVMGNTYDSIDGNRPSRLRWSGIGDETAWTVSASTLSDFRDLPTGGPIRKIVGGEVGIVISDSSVYRMDFIGAPAVFQTDEILPDVGTLSGGSVTSIGDNVYFLSRNGFIELTGNGTGVNRIGAGRVDQYVLKELDHSNLDRISAISDPVTNRVMWSYPTTSATGGRPNRIIIFDRNFNKWSIVNEENELIVSSRGIPITLDELPLLGYTDIDTMTVSLDDPIFNSQFSSLAAFDENFKLGFFRGSNKTAIIETKEVEINQGQKTGLTGFMPIVDGGTVTARIGSRDRLVDTVAYTSSLTLSNSGKFTTRKNARYHQFELTISGQWTDALGVMIPPEYARPSGGRP